MEVDPVVLRQHVGEGRPSSRRARAARRASSRSRPREDRAWRGRCLLQRGLSVPSCSSFSSLASNGAFSVSTSALVAAPSPARGGFACPPFRGGRPSVPRSKRRARPPQRCRTPRGRRVRPPAAGQADLVVPSRSITVISEMWNPVSRWKRAGARRATTTGCCPCRASAGAPRRPRRRRCTARSSSGRGRAPSRAYAIVRPSGDQAGDDGKIRPGSARAPSPPSRRRSSRAGSPATGTRSAGRRATRSATREAGAARQPGEAPALRPVRLRHVDVSRAHRRGRARTRSASPSGDQRGSEACSAAASTSTSAAAVKSSFVT